jgi:uncharacterized membrane protein YeaQ/YmgE (transglycosylase-associated protein family)
MTILEILILLLVAALCGVLAQAIVGYSRGGLIVAMVLGFIGALLGTWMARNMGLPELLMLNLGGTSFPIVWSIIGGTVFVAIIAMVSRRRVYY